MLRNLIFLRFAPYIFWSLLALVTALLLIDFAPAPSSLPYKDKLEHLIAFATLALFGYFSYTKKSLWVYASLAAYGLLMEWMQSVFTLTREASMYDWLADVVGILLCMLIIHMVRTKNHA